MIFSLILFAIFAIVAFFHYTQGFFSAMISAILVTIATVVALGWYEQAAPLLFNINFGDQAASISLIVIFALTYLIPRLICDSVIPGNVRFPFIVDKVGAGVMGVIAGLLGSGIVAVAADALPFGPTIGMYSRFDVADKTGIYMGRFGQMQDTTLNDVVTADNLDPENADHVWLHQDDLVVGLEKQVTGSGSLGTDVSFANVHPALLDELYAQRLGIQVGANHTAITTAANHAVQVVGVYMPSRPIPQIDSEDSQMGDRPPVDPTVKAEADQLVLVVRMNINASPLVDVSDNILRFSAGSVRLVSGEPDNGAPMKDYYPVATLNGSGVALACRPDDFLFTIKGQHTIDFVFVVDRDHVMSSEDSKPPFHLPQGAFFDFKRYSVVDLSGQTVDYGPPPNPDRTSMILRSAIAAKLKTLDGIWVGAPGEEPSSAVSAAQSAPIGSSGLTYQDINASSQLPVPINAGTGNSNGPVPSANGVSGTLKGRKWQQLSVSSDKTIKQLGTPVDDNIQDLAVDPGHVLVQVHCLAPTSGELSNMWAWSQKIGDFTIGDSAGHTYPCVGAWAKVQIRAQRYFVCNYMNFEGNVLQPLASDRGRPEDVWLAFDVPAGTSIIDFRVNAKPVMDGIGFKA